MSLGKWGMLDGLGKSATQGASMIREEWLRQTKRKEQLQDQKTAQDFTLARDKANQDFTLNRDKNLADQRLNERNSQNEWQSAENALNRSIDQARLDLQESQQGLEKTRIEAIVKELEGRIKINDLSIEETEQLRDLRARAINEQDPTAQYQLLNTLQILQGQNPANRYSAVEQDVYDEDGYKTGENVYSFDRQSGTFSPSGTNGMPSLNNPPSPGADASLMEQVRAAQSAGVPNNIITQRLRQQGYSDAAIRQLGI